MATNPANASVIKYVVMSFSLELNQSCGTIACTIISGANLISINGGRVRSGPTPRAGAFARDESGEPFSQGRGDACSEIPALKGSDGSPLATLRQCVGGCGAVTCELPSDSKSPD
jgi:hypothetical protein